MQSDKDQTISIRLRAALPDDAAKIADLKGLVWLNEESDQQHIAAVLRQPEHQTVIAERDEVVLGFTSGFLTLSPDGMRRWEVDLVAVHPHAQGRGIGRRMIAASIEYGRSMEAQLARALIHVDNVGSHRAFANNRFQRETTRRAVAVCSVGGSLFRSAIPTGTYILPVNTLNYRGVWLEGDLSRDSFVAGQNIRRWYGWDTAGAVLPLNSTALQIAESVGYTRIGEYQWWLLALTGTAS